MLLRQLEKMRHATKKGSEDKVSGFVRDVGSEFVCTFDISGRFDSNILYDPGGDLWLCCADGDVKTNKMMTSEVAEEKCGEILDGFGMSGCIFRLLSGNDSVRFEKCRIRHYRVRLPFNILVVSVLSCRGVSKVFKTFARLSPKN